MHAAKDGTVDHEGPSQFEPLRPSAHRRRLMFIGCVALVVVLIAWRWHIALENDLVRLARDAEWATAIYMQSKPIAGYLGPFGRHLPASLVCDIHVQQVVADVSRPVDVQNLVHLRKFTQTESIGISGDLMTDADLRHLASLPNLRELTLVNTRVSFGGLRTLAGCSGLGKLSLQGASFDDLGVDSFRPPQDLKRLELIGTGVTETGLGRLRAAHPEIQIVRDPAPPPGMASPGAPPLPLTRKWANPPRATTIA